MHALKFIYCSDLVVCYVFPFLFFFVHVFISSKFDFHVDAERMLVKTREMLRNICVDSLKQIMYDTMLLP